MKKIEQGYCLKGIFSWMARDREMIWRLVITAGILIILRFAFLIPLPGVDISALQDFFSRVSSAQGMGKIIIFSSGAFSRLTIFGLGLAPFLSSCVLIQLVSIFIPGLRKSRYTYILTIILCAAQSYFISLWLMNPERFEGLRIVSMPEAGFRLVTMATMTAAVFFLIFSGEVISRYGIGNGVAVIAVSFFPFKIFTAWNQSFIWAKSLRLPFLPFLTVIFFCAIIYLIFNITRRAKIIEVQGENSNKISLYFRPSVVGCVPLVCAQSIVLFLAAITSFGSSLGPMFMRGHIVYTVIYAILIFMFTYLYSRIVFRPKHIHNLMRKYGYSCVAKDKSEENYLGNSMSKVLIITGFLLIGLALVPDLVMSFFKSPYIIASLIGGTGTIIAVGVFSDIVDQLVFFKNKKNSGIKEWVVAYAASDEIEAEIKRDFLKNKGIPALVEPLRFTWGLPIGTMVDQYRIYTPVDKQEEAGNLIK